MPDAHQTADIIVIGAGIAGASVAAELAAHASVILLERESQPGYHSTGRSAAVFAPCYGPTPIRDLTRASRAFYESPPEGFTAAPMFGPRPILMIAREDQMGALEALTETVSKETEVEVLTGDALQSFQPLLRAGYASAGMHDRQGQDIDVHALHHGYLRMFKARDRPAVTGAEVTGLTRNGDVWQVETTKGVFEAPIVVNAAGAWAGEIGALAGAEDIGLTPKRRTAITVPDHPGFETGHLPITVDVDEEFYLKPDAGRLLISPADETPVAPCDVQPEELDIAICIDRIMTAFDLDVRRIDSKWAGLRSFVADKTPVVGFSDTAPGFFWLAGQGGYGIQTAPAMAQFAASAVLGHALPFHIADEGFDPADVRPSRIKAAA
ncbi:NAD(P)/FAD-dependent oxidoreductase [Chachezhania antarctica]|uniref:NAD(P)/FAD-dependent oxidoreductase n=1 Tax=Chachezhania antarctica TaxID=2340860 RepID=UPI000EAECAA8|nr:FAD-binding oxidoreductase [Chachezhania antarctica]